MNLLININIFINVIYTLQKKCFSYQNIKKDFLDKLKILS